MDDMARLAFLRSLQRRAQRELIHNYVPPSRYGTAFHVVPPVSDVRALPFSDSSFRFRDQAVWSQLSDDDRNRILSLDLSDPYVAWQVANAGRVLLRIVYVPEGSLFLRLVGDGLFFVIVGRGAQLHIEDDLVSSSCVVRRLFVWQKQDSSFSLTGARVANMFLNERVAVTLLEPGAHTTVSHFIFGSGREQSDVAVSVHHAASGCHSRVLTRSVAAHQHVSVYRGLITIDQDAGDADGFESGEGLLLSSEAVIDMVPQLAIHTNAVRASHGVSITHCDDEMLFYLRSRGLSLSAARRLAVLGFYAHDAELSARHRALLERAVTDSF